MEPADLPAELWRLILSYLWLPELGRCSAVCRGWRQLVLSLDRTRWRQLCLGVLQHRPPNWPTCPAAKPPSWRDACKQHYLASKTWTRNMQDPESSTCLSLFRRRRGRRRLCVGTGGDFGSLRAALAAASPYDQLVLLPGVHEEQSEVLLRVPVELVGQGGLGDVVLRASVDQHGPTARLCNLVLLPPRSSSLLYKVRLGGDGEATAVSWLGGFPVCRCLGVHGTPKLMGACGLCPLDVSACLQIATNATQITNSKNACNYANT